MCRPRGAHPAHVRADHSGWTLGRGGGGGAAREARIQEFRDTLAEELDFLREAANSERCRKDLADLPGIFVPQVRYDLTTRRVLTAEYIHGCKGDDVKVGGAQRRTAKRRRCTQSLTGGLDARPRVHAR